MVPEENKLGFGALIALVIGSMIGGGAFALPQNLASGAEVGAILIGWLITGVGIIALALVYRNLNNIKPELHGGIYSYAKAGFGDYIGFNSAWGYWISAWIGNVSYAVLMFSALGYFIPQFGEGNTLPAIIGASIFLWCIHFLILKGVKEAAIVNIITTIAKLIPILIFLIICVFAFHIHKLTFNFWGHNIGPVFTQIKSTMLVTLWIFIGVEGAVVVSGRAKKKSDVGKATVIGLLGTLIIYMLITLLSFAAVGQSQLAAMKAPSMAYVLQSVVGDWGAALINIGLVIALVGAWLGWTILCAEIPFIAAKDKTLPAFFAKANKNHSPSGALWATNLLIQLFLILVFFSKGTYLMLLKLATSCILLPYLFSGLYALKLTFTDPIYRQQQYNKHHHLIAAAIASCYAIWLVYAAGLTFLLLSCILYAIGIIFYIWAKRENRARLFTPWELILALLLISCSIWAIMK